MSVRTPPFHTTYVEGRRFIMVRSGAASHMADDGENGEQHQFHSADDAHGNRRPTKKIAEPQQVKIAQGVEGAGLQADTG